MITLPKYVIIENKQEMPRPYVLLTRDSLLIGKVMCIQTEEVSGFLDKVANGQILAAKVPGYSVFIMANGCLAGRGVDKEDALPILREMAQFYLDERIKPHPYIYDKRYKDQ